MQTLKQFRFIVQSLVFASQNPILMSAHIPVRQSLMVPPTSIHPFGFR